MSTEPNVPDPKTVREIAEGVANIALHDSVHVDQWIGAVVNSRFGNECSQFRAPLHAAVACRMATVKPSWPDEQPQDGDVRAVAALAAADDDAELDRAVSELIARFADRIAALEARDATDGGVDRG